MERSLETFKAYLEKHDYSITTIKLYLWAYGKFASGLNSQEDIDRYIIGVRKKRGSNPLYIGFLRNYLDCYKLPFIVPKSRRKRSTVIQKPKYIKKEGINHLIKYLPPYYSMMVKLFFDTGLRLTELINIKRDNIDLKKRTMKGIGKGSKPFKVKFSESSCRILARFIFEHTAEYPFHFSPWKKSKLMHPEKSFHYFIKKEIAKLGIEGFHTHQLRHSLAFHLDSKGFKITSIKEKLRHATIKSTEIYARADKEEVDKQIDEKIFGIKEE